MGPQLIVKRGLEFVYEYETVVKLENSRHIDFQD